MFNEKVISMNRMFKILSLTLMLECSVAVGGVARSMDPAQRPLLNQQVSVHDMFKDLSEDEIVMLMEEGQQYIKYMEENASPEEKMAFAQMMEETLKNFSEDDFAEIEKIVKVVEPIFAEREAEPVQAEPIKEESVKKEEIIISGDSSLEYTLHRINKTINGILLKAKSDRSLTETLSKWAKKDDFNELVRLLQVLNKKDHIAKLTAGKTEDVKKLFDTIENFAKRLEVENKQFTVADTFGLEVDEKTSAENSKKFNKILEFFAGATETLLPMVVKFIQDYEPEALKIAKSLDAQAKSSLDAAKQIEKMKKASVDRPYTGQSNAPYNGSYNQQSGYTPSGNNYGNDSGMSARERNKMNAMSGDGAAKPAAGAQPSAEKPKTEADKQKDKEAADKKAKDDAALKTFNDVITKIEQYDDRFDNNAFMDYSAALNKAGKMYDAFGKPLDLSKSDVAPTKSNDQLNKLIQSKKDEERSLKKLQLQLTNVAAVGGITDQDKKIFAGLTDEQILSKKQLNKDFNKGYSEEQARSINQLKQDIKDQQNLVNQIDLDIEDQKNSNTLKQSKSKFGSDIQAAHTHYGQLKETIDNIKSQINEIKSITDATRASLNNMSLQELQKLEMSPALKKLKARFQSYESAFKNIQKELKDKHEKHRLEAADDREVAAYNELKSKTENLHGLDKIISDTRASLDLLNRAIQGDIKRKKRDANKA